MREKTITAILQAAVQECYNKTGATRHEILRAFLKMFDIDPRLVEWSACPDGVARCIFCGESNPKHVDGCAWIG